MYECHGWAVLRESPCEVDAGHLFSIAETVRKCLRTLGEANPWVSLSVVNGTYHLVVTGFSNHRGHEAAEVHDVFRLLCQIAPGSYGLLYVWDDEDTEGYENQFQVWVLARGSMERRTDAYLSPCVPVLEDK
jgi:hypothetical protein